MAKTTTEPEKAPNEGLTVQPVYDPQRDVIQRRAHEEWLRKQSPGDYVTMPNGGAVFVGSTPGATVKFPGEKVGAMLAQPHLLIAREYRKGDQAGDKHGWFAESGKYLGPRYAWRIRVETNPLSQRRDTETQQDHRRGQIRYVTWGEIDSDPCEEIELTNGSFVKGEPIATNIEKYESVADDKSMEDRVISGSYILVEYLDPELAYRKTVNAEDYALQRQRGLPQTVQNSGSVDLAGGSAPIRYKNHGMKITEFAANERRGG